MRLTLLLSVYLCSVSLTFATVSETVKKDTTYVISSDDAILKMVDSMLASKYYESIGIVLDSNIIENSSTELIDSLLEERISLLNQESPIALDYNDYVKAFINLYAVKKRALVSNVLGLAPIYYPMFEEVLDRYNMPLELKHLAVVESALNPVAKSRVGAQGLWQFMYRTGKMYNLNVTSYYDERMDPYKATVAACEYLNDLYGMYGDWQLALAAYNSGPGNVNKAIRRSGGKKNFWEISQYLPRETRGYVPAFIAVNYIMNYYKEHQISANVLNEYAFLTDTIQLNRDYKFSQIAEYIDISEEKLVFLNPAYKLKYIPKTKSTQSLCLPIEKVGLFLANEEAIVADIRRIEIADSIAGKEQKEILPESIQHIVRSGEFLGSIANKYNCTVSQLMTWNNRRSTRLNPGDKLIIYTNGKSFVSDVPKEKEPATLKKDGKYKVHIVRSGDTLWDIAKEYNGTSVNDLKKLNSNLDFKRLKPGMQVKVKEIG
ncbi:MAG: LysM peptidoglycan-binding domain-containing protein [Bacteroidetes bacterium]|nr:MAG: LysM peptidoglycan-binding domain-containing protein [Bacteroidota bacterium]MBL1143721.1 LysM peptidoglycan-binding domain-containing protein [Bacteroidota bacterium]NOG56523.1 transglycosylase SLT domain-containing protein [Bacteroidota bacterium]